MPIRPLLDLRPLADDTLISQLKSLVRRERAITVAVLLRLIEVERRGLHLRRYSSLFRYCVDRLGYSGSAAGRRIYAARCLRDFPRVYELLLEGRLNLTTLCIVGRVLTKENEAELLQRVAGKSEKEVQRIVAALSRPIHPREIIRPIRVRTGGAGSTAPRMDASAGVAGGVVPAANASNANVSSTYVPSVGVPNTNVLNADISSSDVLSASSSGDIDVTTSGADGTASDASATTHAALATGSRVNPPVPVAGAPSTVPPGKIHASDSEAPLSYRIAITVDGAFMEKLERARALVSRSRPGVSVADVFGRTLDEFLMRHGPEERMARRQQRTEKKRAATRGSHAVDVLGNSTSDISGSVVRGISADASRSMSGDVSRGTAEDAARDATGIFSSDPTMRRESVRRGTEGSSDPGCITAAMRDAVWARDGGRCTFVGPEGRCPETRGLHINHRWPRSLGGVAELWNLDLTCSLHNQSEADRVLGKEFMDLHRRRTPGAGVAAPESVRSTSGDALRRETEHVVDKHVEANHVDAKQMVCPEVTAADRSST